MNLDDGQTVASVAPIIASRRRLTTSHCGAVSRTSRPPIDETVRWEATMRVEMVRGKPGQDHGRIAARIAVRPHSWW